MAAPLPDEFLVEAVAQATWTRRVNAAASLVLVYDHILTFDEEVQKIWKRTPWSGAKLLWIGHRYLNLVSFVIIPIFLDEGVRCNLNSWFPFLETIIWQFFISAILSLRCWALFRGSRVVIGILVSVYLCCLGLQIYPTIIGFNLPLNFPPGVTDMGDRYTTCFMGSYMAMFMKGISPWRIAGWIGTVAFDGVVTILTVFRAVRLRMSGLRVSIVETMLQDGLYYFVIVLGLNLSLLITFATVHCALQVMFQRMTQVLTALMISHMCLSLKDNNARVQKEDESYNLATGSLAEWDEVHHTAVSLDTCIIRQKAISSVVGTLGNDLVHTSILDY